MAGVSLAVSVLVVSSPGVAAASISATGSSASSTTALAVEFDAGSSLTIGDSSLAVWGSVGSDSPTGVGGTASSMDAVSAATGSVASSAAGSFDSGYWQVDSGTLRASSWHGP